MPKLGYDISNIENVFSRIIASDLFPTSDMIIDLKKEINTFFIEGECIDIIYTNNNDKLFFGFTLIPVLDYEKVNAIITDTAEVKINSYYLEIDSKLFTFNLNAKELTACILYEIFSFIGTNNAITKVRYAIDDYFMQRNSIMSFKSATQYNQLLNYAIKDIMIKQNSLFNRDPRDVYTDPFIQNSGLSVYLTSALEKIENAPVEFSTITRQPKFSVLEWIFNLYDDVKTNRIPALTTLNTAKKYTGSILIKKEIDNVINALNRIDTDVQLEAAYIMEAVKKKGLIGQIRLNGLKGIENDLYEFKIRIKNLETEDEAMYVLRQINARLTLLQDSLDDMDDREYDRWYKVLEQYNTLREELANKPIWNRKRYGIWYDYNKLDM